VAFKIRILLVGKTRQAALSVLIADYEKRIGHFCEIASLTVKPEEQGSPDQIKEKEGKRLLAKISPDDYLVVLDSQGEQLSSEQLEKFLSSHMDQFQKEVVFLIGGPHGVTEGVKQRANKVLSLSRMTFNHEMVRLFLLEQIYRGLTIRHHLPYHK
jgi:23S rRNA (pseudouridine1915-N3)-methyltransferase